MIHWRSLKIRANSMIELVISLRQRREERRGRSRRGSRGLEPRHAGSRGHFSFDRAGSDPLSLSISIARRKLVRPVAQSEDGEVLSFRETSAQWLDECHSSTFTVVHARTHVLERARSPLKSGRKKAVEIPIPRARLRDGHLGDCCIRACTRSFLTTSFTIYPILDGQFRNFSFWSGCTPSWRIFRRRLWSEDRRRRRKIV